MHTTRWGIALVTLLLTSSGVQAGLLLDRMASRPGSVYPQQRIPGNRASVHMTKLNGSPAIGRVCHQVPKQQVQQRQARLGSQGLPDEGAILGYGPRGSRQAKRPSHKRRRMIHQQIAHIGSLSDAILVGVFDAQVQILNLGAVE